MESGLPSSLRELLRQLDAQGITDYRRYRQVRQYLGFKAREKNLPISGSFELTPLCNLDCKMCYVHLQQIHKVWKLLSRIRTAHHIPCSIRISQVHLFHLLNGQVS